MAAAPSLGCRPGPTDQLPGGAALGTRCSFISIFAAPASGQGRNPAQDLAHAPSYLIAGRSWVVEPIHL